MSFQNDALCMWDEGLSLVTGQTVRRWSCLGILSVPSTSHRGDVMRFLAIMGVAVDEPQKYGRKLVGYTFTKVW